MYCKRSRFKLLLFLATLSSVLSAQVTRNSIITTFSGAAWTFPVNGAQGYNAPISELESIQTDNQGNIIFADPGNHLVSRLNSDGTVSVLAGNGLAGLSGDNGPARSASLNFPLDAVMDSKGNLYIYDSSNYRIRLVNSSGTISTYAGTGVPGFSGDGGAAVAAQIGTVVFLAVDQSGSLYLNDADNCVVRRITTDGVINTFAGTGTCGHTGDGGPANKAEIALGTGHLTFDSTGNLYLAESETSTIRKISPSGVITTIAGTGQFGFGGDNGPANKASFNFPVGLAADSQGNLYVAEPINSIIRKISSAGIVTTIAGNFGSAFSGDGGPPLKASLFLPQSVALDGSGNLYIADAGNYRIRKIGGSTITTAAGNGQFRSTPNGTSLTQAFLFGPAGLAVDPNGDVLIAEQSFGKLAKTMPDGSFRIIAGIGVTAFGGVGGPATQAAIVPLAPVTDSQGNIYFSDSNADVIYKIASGGALQIVAGQPFVNAFSGDGGPALNATFNYPGPFGLAFDQSGNLYAADGANSAIRKIAPNGIITTVAGTGSPGFSGDGGPGNQAKLRAPISVAVDPSGNVIIPDQFNNRIRMVNTQGIITTIAGNGKATSTGDGGPASQATVNAPTFAAYDSQGNLYFLDAGGSLLRKIDTNGMISTIAGTSTVANLGDGGPAGQASLNAYAIAIDKQGTIYLSCFDDDKIRAILPNAPTALASPLSLSFTGVSNSAPSDPQIVNVTSFIASLGFTVTSDSTWLTATGNNTTPSALKVVADPTGLAPGTYSGSLTLAAGPTTLAIVYVTFTVNLPVAPKLAVQTGTLNFSVFAGGSPQSQSFTISNSGGETLNFKAAVSGSGAAAVSLSMPSGTVTPSSPSTEVVTVDPSKLTAGTYTASIVLTNTATGANPATIAVPVTITVAARPQQMALSQRGLLFTAVIGGGVTPPQSFAVLNLGDGQFNWTATVVPTAGGTSWLSVSPNSGTSGATVQPQVTVDPTKLGTAGVYYGLVRITAPGVSNSPQDVEIVLDLLTPDESPGPIIGPSGLVFTAIAGGTDPSSQTFIITNLDPAPNDFKLNETTLDPNNWLEAAPGYGTIPPGASQTIVVQPHVGKLTPGVYSGSVTVQFADFALLVNVKFVVAPASAATGHTTGGSTGCTPTQLIPVFTSFAQQFIVPAAWPIPISVTVVDDCGSPITSGQVVTTFSNGDPPLSLLSLQNGQWQGTWYGVNTKSPRVSVTASATQMSPALKGTLTYTGSLQANAQVPAVSTGGIANLAPSAAQSPVSPGSLITISGTSLAASPTSATQLPLGTDLSGTEVVLGGESLPLIYSSTGVINAIVPYDLDPNSQYTLVVSYGGAFSGPAMVAVASAMPGVFKIDTTGDPKVVQAIWQQVSSGTAFNPLNAGPSTPLTAGTNVTIYCSGLGPVSTTLDPSMPAPSGSTSTANAVSLTIGGVAAQVNFAGLVPGYTGIYQVQATVPTGIAPADGVPVVVSVLGQSSQPIYVSMR